MTEKPSSRRRTFVALVAVVGVVLSGCAGVSGIGDDVAPGQDGSVPSSTTTSVQTMETPTGSGDTTPTAAGSESDAGVDSRTDSEADTRADTETPTTETPSEDDSNAGQNSGGGSSGADDSPKPSGTTTTTETTTTAPPTTTECEPTYAVDPVETRGVEAIGVNDAQWTVVYGEVYNYWAYDVIDEGDIVLDVTLRGESGEDIATKQESVGDLRGVNSTQFAVAFDVEPDRVDRAYATWTVDRQKWIDALCEGDGADTGQGG